MSIDFSKVIGAIDKNGTITQIGDSKGGVAWTSAKHNYVSLGDSIAAGHAINDAWYTEYGTGSQYGSNGRQSTIIVPNTYTQLLYQELVNQYPSSKITAISFAKSGDRVSDLISKLDQTPVRIAIANASIVTICIGANDILGEVNESVLSSYINTGNPALDALGTKIQENLNKLADNNNANSYRALFNKLTSLNPNAKYIFTTIYNPYKYLHLDEGKNGFFYHILNVIPNIDLFGLDVDGYIKEQLLNTDIVKLLFSRVNALAPWVENYVNKLDVVLKEEIAEYNNSNFIVTDTKALFDTYPDRPYSAAKHYNNLVNVEYTSEYETDDMDWGKLWPGSDAGTYWLNLATKYTSLSGININGIASELVSDTVNKVIVPDLDPHPTEYGQYALKRAFADTLGYQALDRHYITYNSNNGSSSKIVQELRTVDGLAAFTRIYTNSFSHGTVGYRFTGWNTASAGGGTAYSNNQLISTKSNIDLYAQWSNIYTLTYKHSYDAVNAGSGDTGPMENYQLWVAGTANNLAGKPEEPLGAFSNPPRVFYLPYGHIFGAVVSVRNGDARSYISLNGTTVAGKGSSAASNFKLTGDVTVNFEWNKWYSGLYLQSYWNCYITGNATKA